MTPEELQQATRTFPVFDALRPADLLLLRDRGRVRSLRAGETFIRAGDECTATLFALAGRLRVSKSSPTGREITLYHVGPGETCILSVSCVLGMTAPYPASATVVEDAIALLVPGDLFRQLTGTYEPVRELVFAQVGERLAGVMALVQEVAFARVDRRVAGWLVQHSVNGGTVTATHEEIASHLGTARVVVSRVLEGFADRGWITQGRRRIDIRDAAALARYGNQSD